jgi:hypothetical protein
MVRESRSRGVLAEIAASSPAHPERGTVSIGYDGFMIWERWAPAADSDRAAGIVRLIAWILTEDHAPIPDSPVGAQHQEWLPSRPRGW